MGHAKDYEEELWQEAYRERMWQESVQFMPYNPVKWYKHCCPKEDLPEMAIQDGYSEHDSSYIASYRKFERELLEDSKGLRDLDRDIHMGKIILKNNIFIDPSASKLASINRVEMNIADGFINNTIISGQVAARSPETEDSWFSSQEVQEYTNPVLVDPNMFASRTYDIEFGKKQVGNSNCLFLERDHFKIAYSTEPVGHAEALLVNDARNPELIQFKTKLGNIRAFNNIYAYCNATGQPNFVNVSTAMAMLNYLAHEVLNVLVPKHIVLVIDSSRGLIDIPRKDYIPNIPDPVKNIPDYNNKMNHIVFLMKQIAQKGMLHYYLGNIYLKMSITPALVVINMISEYAPHLRLILAISTIDNELLADIEDTHSIFPAQYIMGSDNGINKRSNISNNELLEKMGSRYHDNLLGLDEREVIHTYNINTNNNANINNSPFFNFKL